MEEFDDYYAVARARALRDRLEFQADLTIAKVLDRSQANSINRERRQMREEIEELLFLNPPKVDLFDVLKQTGGML